MKKTLLLIENWHPKAFILLVFLFAFTISGYSQGVAISNTATPTNSSAGLDVNFTNKGLLIPRVTLVSLTSATPLAAHVPGMIVYNPAPNANVTPGFYFNNGSKWIPALPVASATGQMQYWDGTTWVAIPTGFPGQRLTVGASGLPVWGP